MWQPPLVRACCASLMLFTSPDAYGAAASSSGSAAAEINACDLLEPSEIEAAIGLPVNLGARDDSGLVSNGAYSSTCVWTVRLKSDSPDLTKPLGGKSFVILNVMQWPSGSGLAHTFLDAFREAAASGELPSKPVMRMLGDEALWWGDGLAVRKGDVSFGISTFLPHLKRQPRPRLGAMEERLASRILRRIEQRADLPRPRVG
jgi:hypothetical protein